MIQYLKESFSIPFFIATLLLNIPNLVQIIFKIEIDQTYLSIILFLDLLLMMFYLFDLRKKIGDSENISFGKFFKSFFGGGIFCCLTFIIPLILIFLILITYNPKKVDALIKDISANRYNIFVIALIFYIQITHSNCLYRLKTTFSFKEVFKIFTFKEFKNFFVFFIFTLFITYCSNWIYENILNYAWYACLNFLISSFSTILYTIQISYLVKLQSENFSNS